MSETEQRMPTRTATHATPPPLQWGEYVASPLGPVDSTGRVRWRICGPGVATKTLWMTRDEARRRIAERLRAWGLEYDEVEVAWAEMPALCAPVNAGSETPSLLPSWAVTDRSKRLPDCIIVGCGTHRYQRGLCWAHLDAVTQAGIKDLVALPPVRGSRGGR
jgi:hypothetical protein